MAYIYPAPGVANVESTLTLVASGVAGNLLIPALQDITVNNANDVFTWTQLDEGSKLQIATTATNSLAMNLVLDQTVFFGNAAAATGSALKLGVFGLSAEKTLTNFSLYMGDTSTGDVGKTITGSGYVTGLAPTVSADAPVWVSPITITVTGDYTIT
jgi:hypothetical protein